jgi:hypothetical protein
VSASASARLQIGERFRGDLFRAGRDGGDTSPKAARERIAQEGFGGRLFARRRGEGGAGVDQRRPPVAAETMRGARSPADRWRQKHAVRLGAAAAAASREKRTCGDLVSGAWSERAQVLRLVRVAPSSAQRVLHGAPPHDGQRRSIARAAPSTPGLGAHPAGSPKGKFPTCTLRSRIPNVGDTATPV